VSEGYSQRAQAYIDDILSGKIPACRWTKLAVERAMRDMAHTDEAWAYRFDSAKAQRAVRFIEKLRHVKSSIATKAGDKIILCGWQVWATETLYGWVRKDTGNRRWKKAYIEVGKGNGKSTWAGAIAIYDTFCCGEGGADALLAASMREQANIILNSARQMLQRDKEMCRKVGLTIQAHDIVQHTTQSKMRALPAKASSVEGVQPSLAILDEVHAARGRELYDTLSTACAKRSSGLFLMVTTAGNDAACLGYELHMFIEQLLNQEVEEETFFSVLYGIDPNDEWNDPISWQKANPSWGVSVDPVALEAEAKVATLMPGARNAFRIFHLSEWIANGADNTFLDFNAVRACYEMDLKEEDFADQPAVLACDLASKLDLCSLARVHTIKKDGKTHFYVFSTNWLPSQAVANSNVAALRTWAETKQLVVTPGAVTNQDDVEEEIFQQWRKCKMRDMNYDPAQATMMMTHLRNRTEAYDSFIEVTQFARNMTDGMNLLQEIVADGRLHTNSPVLLWCLGNLRAQHGGLHFVWPVRPKDRQLKIDAAVALVMALKSIVACPLDESNSESPYAKRGIIVLDYDYRWKCAEPSCEVMIQSYEFCKLHNKGKTPHYDNDGGVLYI
jgi:phage terminase large subunit-like protein